MPTPLPIPVRTPTPNCCAHALAYSLSHAHINSNFRTYGNLNACARTHTWTLHHLRNLKAPERDRCPQPG